MRYKSDIVKLLRDEEKKGILQSKIHCFSESVGVKNKVSKNVLEKTSIFRNAITDREKNKTNKSSREKPEELYRTIIELSPDSILTMNLHGIITSCNPAAVALSGYSYDELVGNHFMKLGVFHKKDIQKYMNLFFSIISGKSVKPIEIEYFRKDGSAVWCETRVALLKDKKKKIGVIAITRDITERKKVEEQLRRTHEELSVAHKQLKDLNQNLEAKIHERTLEVENLLHQKEEFINRLGHDLKTPLSILINIIPLIHEQLEDHEGKQDCNIAIRNISYMKRLITETLKMAELCVPANESYFTELNLSAFVNTIITDHQLAAHVKDIHIENMVDENVIVRVDELKIKEVFNNLINNAIKFTPEGGRITLNSEESKDGDDVTIGVGDTGIGMTEEQLLQVFDDFYKADASRHDLRSSGLGLSICKRIVEEYGGRIWAESRGSGKGSTFYFTLKHRLNVNGM